MRGKTGIFVMVGDRYIVILGRGLSLIQRDWRGNVYENSPISGFELSIRLDMSGSNSTVEPDS